MSCLFLSFIFVVVGGGGGDSGNGGGGFLKQCQSHCAIPGWTGTHFGDQADLEFTCLYLLPTGIKGIHHHAYLSFFKKKF